MLIVVQIKKSMFNTKNTLPHLKILIRTNNKRQLNHRYNHYTEKQWVKIFASINKLIAKIKRTSCVGFHIE